MFGLICHIGKKGGATYETHWLFQDDGFFHLGIVLWFNFCCREQHSKDLDGDHTGADHIYGQGVKPDLFGGSGD